MNEGWEEVTLDQVYEFKSGLSKPRAEFGFGSGFVSFKDVFYNFFIPDELTGLVNSNEREQSSCSVQRGDVFLTRTSETFNELGMSSVALRDYPNATFNGFTKRLRPLKKDVLHPEYVGYYFRSSYFRKLMNSFATMSTRASLNNEILSKLSIKFPSYSTQVDIANQLKHLDDKIHLLRQQNATLESMSQALFKSWFVDFDPVIDNALAAGRDLPEALAVRVAKRRVVLDLGDYPVLPEGVRGLFPDSFVFSEGLGRWVPVGWGVKMLSQLGKKISKGTTPRKSDVEGLEEVIPFLKVRNLSNNGKIDINSLDMIPESVHYKQLKRSVLQSGDLLFSIAGTIGRVAIVPDQLENCNCNQALAFIRLKKEMLVEELVHQFLISHQTQHLVLSKIVQAVQANVSLTTLGELELVVPNKALLQYWKNSIIPYYKKMSEIDSQIQTLTRLRDVLVPELISGRVGV
jgi:type I restriction enzyme S subunit